MDSWRKTRHKDYRSAVKKVVFFLHTHPPRRLWGLLLAFYNGASAGSGPLDAARKGCSARRRVGAPVSANVPGMIAAQSEEMES